MDGTGSNVETQVVMESFFCFFLASLFLPSKISKEKKSDNKIMWKNQKVVVRTVCGN